MKQKTPQTPKNNFTATPTQKEEFALGKTNYILIAIAFALVVIGFLLMLGGSTTDESFNPDIFSTRRIAVGPTIAFLGFVCIVPAILYRPKKKEISNNEDTVTEK